MLGHGEAKALITDTEFAPTIREALGQMDRKILVIDADDPMGKGGDRLGVVEYEDLLAEGDENFTIVKPQDEWQAIDYRKDW